MRKRPDCPMPESQKGVSRKRVRLDCTTEPLSPEEARMEAARCLSLHECRGCEVCVLICPDQAITKDPDSDLPVIDLQYCKGCGLCAHLCPRGAITMVRDFGLNGI